MFDVTTHSQGYLWEAYYEHKSASAEYDDEDILIKADDDIVFVDVDKFGDFLANIQTAHVYFPNIVNNDAGLYVQGSRKAHQQVTDCLEEYETSIVVYYTIGCTWISEVW